MYKVLSRQSDFSVLILLSPGLFFSNKNLLFSMQTHELNGSNSFVWSGKIDVIVINTFRVMKISISLDI